MDMLDDKDLAKDYSIEELSKYFHMPINDVSTELGICATLLKKICRKNGINRWPHRKIKSLDNMIESFEHLVEESSPEDQEIIGQDIVALKQKRAYLLANPNVSYSTVLPKHAVNAFNARIQRTGISEKLKTQKYIPLPVMATRTIVKQSYPRRSARNFRKEHRQPPPPAIQPWKRRETADNDCETSGNVLRDSNGQLANEESAARWLLELYDESKIQKPQTISNWNFPLARSTASV